jgi:uncharacterized protein (TIGR00255 family)
MTGYGRGECTTEDVRCVAEIRSVNHRFSEVMVRLPSGWMALEEPVKKEVRSVVKRGRADVFVTVEARLSAKEIKVNEQVAEKLVHAAKKLKEVLGLEGTLTLAEIMQLPDVLQVKEEGFHPESYEQQVLQAVKSACASLKAMRIREGEALAKDLITRVEILKDYVKEIGQRAPQVVEDYRKRLHQRLQDFLSEGVLNADRIAAEAAIFAERSDIQEELTRLNSHLDQFLHTLSQPEPVGRRLDFLLQEMNREVNTIGSKANDQRIGSRVVDCKSELEKMREQVQNIE